MGKCVDNFDEIMSKITHDYNEGKIDINGINIAYNGMIAGFLAIIVDELNELNETNKEALSNSKKAQEDLMTFNREMQNDLRRNRDESKT